MRLEGALFLIGTLGACGGLPPPPPPPSQVKVTLGSTALDGTGWVPLEGDKTLVPGAQGGFHIWLKYRVAGMSPQKVQVHRTAHRVSDGASVLVTDGVQDIGAANAEGYWELPMAVPSFMCPTPIGVSVIDQQIRFELKLTSMSGAPLADESGEATVHCPTDDQASHCMQICSG